MTLVVDPFRKSFCGVFLITIHNKVAILIISISASDTHS